MAKGSCACKKLTFEITGEPVLCHCLECRKLTPSFFTTSMFVPATSFSITGAPKHYVFTQEAGDEFTTSFCGNCGTTVCKETQAEGFKGLVIVEAGALNVGSGVEYVKPEGEIWVKHRVGWLKEGEGLVQHQEMPN
ncbi:uncharacterized protein BDZ99DRAFT_403637 [Mytilinidion resinicola]|uniref:CENP-V/GFA domain-containing protein n=1 Tax=Mytilinidion resinicola TaxID=574789 RepID=A0A6A6XXP9_9PEZI|nr:uncharacterized protein BDZ99DRAFT_403637 [Mytilinidion resinicola]KAF2801321.1 hypothetical protein BDZ99DRAFT_403637 [Mytilinidion resinicola]